MELDRKEINGSVYYELYVCSPRDSAKGISSPLQFFIHEACGGRMYIGDNAHFLCDGCQQESRVEDWKIRPCSKENEMSVMTEEGEEKLSSAEIFAIAGQIVGVTGIKWLKKFLDNYIEEF